MGSIDISEFVLSFVWMQIGLFIPARNYIRYTEAVDVQWYINREIVT